MSRWDVSVPPQGHQVFHRTCGFISECIFLCFIRSFTSTFRLLTKQQYQEHSQASQSVASTEIFPGSLHSSSNSLNSDTLVSSSINRTFRLLFISSLSNTSRPSLSSSIRTVPGAACSFSARMYKCKFQVGFCNCSRLLAHDPVSEVKRLVIVRRVMAPNVDH